jgi:hypothetical protein
MNQNVIPKSFICDLKQLFEEHYSVEQDQDRQNLLETWNVSPDCQTKSDKLQQCINLILLKN